VRARPPAIDVLAALIERDGRFLVTRRLNDTHLAGYWEFPGGKCEPGESHADCLARELMEELGVRATIGDEALTVEHAYPERTVRLYFRWCQTDDTPRPVLGPEMCWITRREMAALEFPEADRALIELLTKSGA
jgi:mutator protein MutT